jgi:predicted transposase YdaD
MKTDKLFYRLFHAQPELVLELAGVSPPYALGYRQQSLELKREDIRVMLHLPDTDLRQTRFYREVFAEGEARGERKAEVTLVLRQLRRRLGPLSKEYEAKVQGLSRQQIERMAEDLLDFRESADMVEWLESHH